jgi:catechol 2,3-dioxygenase-like lactoylglutathione lyase family enzyme
MTPSASESAKFHVALNVTDVARSVAFYQKFLDRPPAKQTVHYAKFELTDPPLVLSLISGRAGAGGNLNHAGMRLPNAEVLLQMQTRLEKAGITTKREEGVECCHSRQTKFWANDPDGILWEIYIFHENVEEEAPPTPAIQTPAKQAKIIWRHQIPDPFPARIPHQHDSVHEVALEGSANLNPRCTKLSAILAEVYRVLRPGGEITLHGLSGHKTLQRERPDLPGPAAAVEYVPVESEPMSAMIAAGFVQVRFAKLSAVPNFIVDGVQMREFLLTGFKPGHRPSSISHVVIYLGPLAQVVDDAGNVFPRGRRIKMNINDWQILSQSEVAGQFLFLPPEKTAKQCC